MKPTLLHESAQWMVIAKPAGYHTLDGKDVENPSVEAWVKQEFAPLRALTEAGIVHRLDQGTSGCLLVAKDEESRKEISHAFRLGQGIRKFYLAIVSGKMSAGNFKFYYSSRYRSSKKITVSLTGPARDLGECAWKVEHADFAKTTLEVELIGPGKRHQIRAGLAHLKHPILGDELYGGPDWGGHLALHASKLVIGAETVECPRPLYWGE